MKAVDMGYLRAVITKRSNLDSHVITEASFADWGIPDGLSDLDNERCYLVKKDELDAYMARKEQLEKKNDQLNEIIEQLITINKFLQLGDKIGRDSAVDNLKLNIELAKYRGVQEVTDIHATNDQDSYVLMWTDREGQKRKIELKLVQNPMDETTRIGTTIYE